MRTEAIPMKVLLQLSWRNIWRHRRRNMMLLSAILVAVATVILANSLIRGWQAQMLDTVVENLTGHVKVTAPGYREDPSIERGFSLPVGYRPALDGVDGWTSRVRVPGVILSERDTRGVQLVGVDPADELEISFLADVSLEGEFLTGPADRRVLIGAALAERLETGVGRRIVLMTQGSDGRNREAGFRVSGVYTASSRGLERAFVFTAGKRCRRCWTRRRSPSCPCAWPATARARRPAKPCSGSLKARWPTPGMSWNRRLQPCSVLRTWPCSSGFPS